MSVKSVRFFRADAKKIIEKYDEFISRIFVDYIIAGSYSRNEETIGDIDVVCDINKVNHNLIRQHISSISWEFCKIYEFELDDLNFSFYCVEEKYIPSSLFLIKGPNSRCDMIWEKAEKMGYYMTHFGLLKKEKEIEFRLRDEECYFSNESIQFKTEEEYSNFLKI